MELKMGIVLLLVATGAKAEVLPLGYPCEVFSSSNKPGNDTLNCPAPLYCNGFADERYRTMNGTCNNLESNTLWGSAGSPFGRFVPRNPLDKYGYPPVFRSPQSQTPLPNARMVSSVIHSGADQTYPDVTTMLMHVGQFIDHDITLTVEVNFCSQECPVPEVLNCCDYVNKREQPKSCIPIAIPADDPFYSNLEGEKPTCLDLKRSMPYPCDSKNYSQADQTNREQFNVLTAYLDGSQIYGSDKEKNDKLRLFRDGLMKTSEGRLLPMDEPMCKLNLNGDPVKPAFFGGDVRTNENPGLMAQHVLWLREHNRLAKSFKSRYPQLSDEQMFQETRRFLVAEWQHIIYSEFLPIILGPKVMKQLELSVSGPSVYRPNLSPNIFNGFAAAAYRFGHSFIVGKIALMAKKSMNYTSSRMSLSDGFFNTEPMLSGKMDQMLRGMTMQAAELGNNIIDDEVRNKLFRKPGKKFGDDLPTRNIQRGRDHELGTYDSYRQACGLEPLPTSFFSVPPREFTPKMWSRFSRVYSRPRDIELFPGGMSELTVEGGVIGPTFACIIGEQFRRLKFADRYFFTHANVSPKIRFCESDLRLIRERSMNDVLCDNTDMEELPPNVFLGASVDANRFVTCDQSTRKYEPEYGCRADQNNYDSYVKTEDTTNDDSKSQVAVIAGGYDGWQILSSVELYSASGRCQHYLAPLPEAVYGLIMHYTGNQLLACGGRSATGIVGERCWRYVRDSRYGSWVEEPSMRMRENRWLAAGVKVEGRYYVTGGLYASKTSEFFDPVLQQWVAGPPLFTDRVQHCMVYGKNRLLLLGGTYGSTVVEELDVASYKWVKKPDMLAYRQKHACILLPDNNTVLTFGGSLFSSLYDTSRGISIFGSDNILARGYGAAVELNGRVILLGGESQTTRVEEFDYSEGKFKLVDARTLEGRSRFAVAKVPARLFQHLPGGCNP